MKRGALAWLAISAVAVACSSGGGGPNAGSAGAGQAGGAGGAAGRGGSGAKGGTGGSTTGSAGTTGVGGAAGTAGTTGAGGAAGSAGTTGVGGASGAAGSAGTTGVGGAAGTAGSAGTTGLGGAGGSGGRGGIGGSSGGGAGGSTGGSTGTGGRGGTGGSSGGGVGGAGTGGGAGASGSGGSGGGSSGPVHVTSAQALPNFQGSSRLVAVDSQDTAVVVGPSAASDSEDPGPRITWIPRQGSPHGMTYANAVTPSAMAIDPSRNVWLMGQLFRAVSFGGPTLQPIDNGYYLVRLDSDGNPALSRAITRAESALVYGATADAQGNVYAVGNVYSAGSPLTSSVFVTKFSSAGDELYTQEFASQGTTAYGADIAVASSGNVFIVGAYNSPLQIGTVVLTLPASSIGSGFVAALDAATGAPNWATRVGGSDFDIVNSIEVTGTGALRIAGMVTGSATVGGVTVQADANGSPFIAELTSSGNGNWVKLIQGAGIVFAADTSATGHTFAVGYVNGTTKDTFVADVTADGTATLPLRVTVPDDTNGANIAAADRHGGVWVTGDFKGSVDFGLGALSAGGATTFADFLVHLEP